MASSDTGSDPDDSTLLKRCVKRDEAAFAILYERYAEQVLRYCRGHLTDMDAAEDVAQDAFFLLWSKARKVTIAGGTAWPWLFTTAKYLVRNHQRKKDNQPKDDVHELDVTRVLVEMSTEDRYAQHDDIQRVHSAVAAMSTADQQVFLGFFIGGSSHAELARTLGLSKAAVKNRILRIRTRIKAEFADTPPGGGEQSKARG